MKRQYFRWRLAHLAGMAEFGIMGVLTELAHDTGISIPSAGNMISFYAFGVVIGAPIVALFSGKFSLKPRCCFWWRCALLAMPCLRFLRLISGWRWGG